ncbi:MAG TPA: thermonuclease family protein [Burkholderiales bacterium]|jgi:endonuclease YncB( thermonuclease family)|nr:thermonuclease family protein [Burkholderiales bacterium]
MGAKTVIRLAAWAAILGLLHATAGLAADNPSQKRKSPEKKWQALDNCRYVAREANDGDSFGLQCASRKFVLRLYFVDAPEANLQYAERVREQAQHFGTTLDETLNAGYRARDLVRNLLGGAFIVLTKRANAPGRSSEPRFYGLVQVGGQFLHEVLLVEGLSRVKGVTTALPNGTPSRDYVKRLQALENQARLQRKGVWARSLK